MKGGIGTGSFPCTNLSCPCTYMLTRVHTILKTRMQGVPCALRVDSGGSDMTTIGCWTLLAGIRERKTPLGNTGIPQKCLCSLSEAASVLLEPCIRKLFFPCWVQIDSSIRPRISLLQPNVGGLWAWTWIASPSHQTLATSSTSVLIVPWREPAVGVSNHALLFVIPCAMQMGTSYHGAIHCKLGQMA